MPDYFFKPGSRSPVILRLKKDFFNTRPYLKIKNKLTDVYDDVFVSSIAEYQIYHKLKLQGGVLNEETYAEMGKELSEAQIEMLTIYDPDLRKLLYGIGLIDVCAEWEAVAPIIAKEDFIGWKYNYPKTPKNCFTYCSLQLTKAGHDLKSPGWGTPAKMNAGIYQLFLEEDVAGMKKGSQAEQFTNGTFYLKKAIKSKIPVMVGVNAHPDLDKDGKVKHDNKDKVTDHYVVVVGMNSDDKGKYFLFYDNATGDNEVGTSDKNRIYCDCKNFTLSTLKGQVPVENTYINGGYGFYLVTQIRESK